MTAAHAKNTCTMVKHSLKTSHKFNFDNPTVLKYKPNYKSRLFLEMVNIKKNKNIINYKSETNQIINSLVTF